MADPEMTHDFVWNVDGDVDLGRSPFFQVGFGYDRMEDKYLDMISYQIVLEIERGTGESPWHPYHPESSQLLSQFADQIRQHFRDYASTHYPIGGSTTTDDSSDSDSAISYSFDSYSGFSESTTDNEETNLHLSTTDDESCCYWTASDGYLDFVSQPELIEDIPLSLSEFNAEEFQAADVDPIFQFSVPISSHMNKDHAEDTQAIVQHSTSIKVDLAYILDVDSLGFNVKASYQGDIFKLRISFPRRAQDRKDVKNLIVEMLQAAKATV